MNPTPLVMLDTIAQSFDEAGTQVAPLITFEFRNESDLHNYLTVFESCLNKYASNPILLKIQVDEINKFNDVFVKFSVRAIQ